MMNNTFADINDITALFRTLTAVEETKTNVLLPVVADTLRLEARKVGLNLDDMVTKDSVYANVVKSVVVDIVARNLMTSTQGEPMSQMSESALGYSFSGTFLNPGGGLFIKQSELRRLGFRKQRIGGIELYGAYTGDNSIT